MLSYCLRSPLISRHIYGRIDQFSSCSFKYINSSPPDLNRKTNTAIGIGSQFLTMTPKNNMQYSLSSLINILLHPKKKKRKRHFPQENFLMPNSASTCLDMYFKRHRPHTWLEIEESDFTNTQPISQITK